MRFRSRRRVRDARGTEGSVGPPREGLRRLVTHGVAPAVGLGVANVVVGRALAGRRGITERETAMVERLQEPATPAKDRASRLVSTVADVPASVLHGIAAVAILRHRTGSWRTAALPAVALILETGVYLSVGAVVNRERPAVPRRDHEQPTSSFPSGHQGATVALMTVYAGLARDIRSPALRAAINAACVAYPAALAWSRMYVGMHYPSDVAAGTANGLAAGLLARSCLRRS